VGGTSSSNGNVFARNPANGIYGPVCDDAWEIADVINFEQTHISECCRNFTMFKFQLELNFRPMLFAGN